MIVAATGHRPPKLGGYDQKTRRALGALAVEHPHDQVAGDPVVLGDEVLTPDSSRFWPADLWRPGQAQPSYDKQIVRNWLLSPASGWDRASGDAPPPLPDDDSAARWDGQSVHAWEGVYGDYLTAKVGGASSKSSAQFLLY